MKTEHPLSRLIGGMDLLGVYWNKKHSLFKQVSPVDGLIDEDSIQSILDTGLLRWPYFTLIKDGRQPELAAFTATRTVAGQKIKGFADAQLIRIRQRDSRT